jgi:GNAT superfamily N-acetyltransferase
MVKIEIREATEKDLPEVLSLFKQPDVDHDVLLIKDAQKIFNRITNYPNYKIYVAEADQKVLGTFCLLIMDKLSHMGAKSGIVDDVVVHPDWQGKGIGKNLMRFAMDQCKKTECYKLMLSSNIKRKPAHQFYEKLGFMKHSYSFAVEFSEKGKGEY